MGMFPTDEVAEKWFESIVWDEGRFCPHCGSLDTKGRKSRKPMPYWCRDCHGYFSIRTGTPMHRSKIALRDWAYAILPALRQPQGRQFHAAAPRTRHQPEIRLAHGAPHPRGVRTAAPVRRRSRNGRGVHGRLGEEQAQGQEAQRGTRHRGQDRRGRRQAPRNRQRPRRGRLFHGQGRPSTASPSSRPRKARRSTATRRAPTRAYPSATTRR